MVLYFEVMTFLDCFSEFGMFGFFLRLPSNDENASVIVLNRVTFGEVP